VAFETRCAICEETVDDPGLLTECMGCGRWFHLRRRMDQPGTDCGDAIVGEALGVETYCQPCLDRMDREAAAAMTKEDRAMAVARMMMGEHAPRPAQPDPTVPPPPPGRRRFQRVEDAE